MTGEISENLDGFFCRRMPWFQSRTSTLARVRQNPSRSRRVGFMSAF